MTDIKKGDRIKFCSPTRDGAKTVWRKVTGFWINGEPQVSFNGWSGFVVHRHEIKEVAPGYSAPS